MKRGRDSAQPPPRSGARATSACVCTHQATFQADERTTRLRSRVARVKPGRTRASRVVTHSMRGPRRKKLMAPTQHPSVRTSAWRRRSQLRKSGCSSQWRSQHVRHTPAKFMAQQHTQMTSAAIRKHKQRSEKHRQTPTIPGYEPAINVSDSPSRTSASIFSRVTRRSASRREWPLWTKSSSRDSAISPSGSVEVALLKNDEAGAELVANWPRPSTTPTAVAVKRPICGISGILAADGVGDSANG
mmetsp:Transcript_34077/g.95836  ORF Transcript_34077/g.95836 Transcript_34077/m.95836 type:complete len:245 (-) Transcript_34077:216-950(-)